MEQLVDVEANPLRELLMTGMNEAQKKKRGRQLAFMLTMHTKDRALQMITKLSDPTNGFEIWRRFLEEWEPAHRGRCRARLMQFLQFPFAGDRGQAVGGVRETRAAINQGGGAGTHPTGSRMMHVGLNAATLQGYDALRVEWKAVQQAYRQWNMADGSEATPMEIDALTKGKGRRGQG